MPSIRKQKAKARKSREMDMMSDFKNMDVMLGNNSINTIERELSNVIGNTGNHRDTEPNPQPEENETRENDFGHFPDENVIPRQDRFHETMETFTSEFNMRLTQEMDSMMAMMHSQINRAINTAMDSRSVGDLRSPRDSSPYNCQELQDVKDSRSVGDLRSPRDSSPYNCQELQDVMVRSYQENHVPKKNFIV